MSFDFTTVIDRHGMDSLAVDGIHKALGVPEGLPRPGFDVIPMWVADMSFATCPSVINAMQRRLEHPIFGYYDLKPEYFDSIIHWQKSRNGVEGLLPEHIGYENSVLGGVVSALKAIASLGDAILIHAPTYVGFTNALRTNGYRIVLSPLVQDTSGTWRMDLVDMEEKIVKYNIHATIFCSPHNPTGRVWERAELEAMMELFRKHDVTVISDEIWSDLLLFGSRHIPLQSVSEDAKNRTIALYAPSKTFNLAGLIGSYHIIYNQALRHRVTREGTLTFYNHQNVLSMYALLGAYQPEGALWTDALCQVLSNNADFAYAYITTHFDGIKLTRPQGTYVLFLDCSEWCASHGKTLSDLLQAGWEVGVLWQDGRPFHGLCHIRMNLALPTHRVKEAFERLNRYVFHP